MSYSHPDKSSAFAPSDHPEWVGQLFLIWPTSVENIVFTRKDGSPDPTDIVQADVAIITLMDPETNKPVFLKDARIGGKALTPQIKKQVGSKVLGRLAQSPRQGEKSGAFYLEDWTPQDVQMAEQYEVAFPHNPNAPAQPSGATSNGGQPWQTNAQQSAPQQAAQAPWGQQATPPPSPQWQQTQTPAAGWNATAPSQTAPTGQQWQAAPAAPTVPPNGVDNWPPGLADFLKSKDVDLSKVPDEATARQIAATYANG